jgi:hypothetical protein
MDPAEPIASQQAQRACPRAHVVKVVRLVGGAVRAAGRLGVGLTRAGRLRSMHARRGSMRVRRVLKASWPMSTPAPSATSLEWIVR